MLKGLTVPAESIVMNIGTAAVGYRTESLHGAGSPQAQRIMLAR